MKIVSVNVHYQDGLGYQDYYLGKEMHLMGHEVHFISSDHHFDFPNYESIKHIIGDKYVGVGTFINEYGVPVHRLKSTKRTQTGLIWLIGFKKKVLELKPNVLILHGVFSFQTIRILFFAHQLNCKIIFDDHTTINVLRKNLSSSIIFGFFRFFFSKKIEKIAHKIVGISDSCIEVLDTVFGLRGKKVEMIPLGTDTNLFRKDVNLRLKYRKTIGADEKTIVVLYTGKIYPEKKVDLIFEALNEIDIPQNYSILIHIVGFLSDEYKLDFETKMKKSKHHVVFRKAVSQDQLPEIYNSADIAVWPAHTTTSTIDASACACPIICSDYMTERYANNNGIGIKDGNLDDLKDALQRLIADPKLRQSMGDNGVELIENTLSWKVIAKQFIS